MDGRTIAVIVVAVLVVGGLTVVLYDITTPDPTSMTVTFYDTEGNPVWQESSLPSGGLFGFDFQNKAGAIVDKMTIEVTWNVDGVKSGSTVEVSAVGSLAIQQALDSRSVWSSQDTALTGTDLTGTYTADFYLSNIITNPTQDGKDYGWKIMVSYTLTVTETLADGSTREASKTLDAPTLSITWVEPEALSIDGTIGYV